MTTNMPISDVPMQRTRKCRPFYTFWTVCSCSDYPAVKVQLPLRQPQPVLASINIVRHSSDREAVVGWPAQGEDIISGYKVEIWIQYQDIR